MLQSARQDSRFHLVKKWTKFYGNRRFITTFTRARCLSLSWPDQSIPRPHSTSRELIIILSSPTLLDLRSCLLSGFQNINLLCISSLPHRCHLLRPSHSSWFGHPINIWWGAQIMKLLNMQSLPVPLISGV